MEKSNAYDAGKGVYVSGWDVLGVGNKEDASGKVLELEVEVGCVSLARLTQEQQFLNSVHARYKNQNSTPRKKKEV